MIVRILSGFVHFKPDGDWIMAQVGEVVEMPAGAKWVQDGLAVPMEEKPASRTVETATIRAGEISEPPAARRRRK